MEGLLAEQIKVLQEQVNRAKNIVFFGGAGVSTESGIPDFRSENGLYRQKFKYPPEVMLSRTFFDSDPREFYEFYKERMLAMDAKSNAAHIKLAEMEKKGKLSAVITQNIDGLHQKAGSKTVYELHGSIYRNFCMRCGKAYGVEKILSSDKVPHCDCGGIVKPSVVLYEEPLPEDAWTGAAAALENADMLIIAGTSLTVYPAAYLVQYFKGNFCAVINLSQTSITDGCDLSICARVGETLSQIRV